MTEKNPYHDKRTDFFQAAFGQALPYEQYVSGAEEQHRLKWERFDKSLALTPGQREVLSTFRRHMNVLCLSGIWCGDCARQGPMLKHIAEAAPSIALRFAENRRERELQEELRLNGAEKVPVVVVLSEDFYEIGRFGDRHLSEYRRKAAMELGPACDPGIAQRTPEELQNELQEWLDYFERLQLMLRLAPALRKRYGD